MKHLKIYETFDKGKVTTNAKKLISCLMDLFIAYGFDYSNYYDNRKYETEYFYNSDNILFNVGVDAYLGNNLSIIIYKNEDFYRFILQYFKTINGLNLMLEDTGRIIFNIPGTMNNVIKQITYKDFESKYELYKSTNKFNI